MAWLRELLDALSTGAGEIAHYRHWDEALEPSADHEARKLRGRTPELVVAKSLGTVIASSAHASHEFRPRRAVLIGVPLLHVAPEVVDACRRLADDVPTLFIQQTADMFGPFAELRAAIGDSTCGQFAEVPGQDHYYGDIAALTSIIESWAST